MVDGISPLKVSCPACGKPMVERQNSKNTSTFLACTGYAGDEPGSCRETMPVPAYVAMIRSGASPLPGFGDEPTFSELESESAS